MIGDPKTQTNATTEQRAARQPAAFRLDDPGIALEEAPVPAVVALESDADDAAAAKPVKRRLIGFGALILSGLLGLLLLALGLAVEEFVRGLLTRNPVIGSIAAGLAGLVVLGLVGLALRELRGLSRLSQIDGLRKRAEAVVAGESDTKSHQTVAALTTSLARLYRDRPETARARATIAARARDVLDPADRLGLAERDLFAALDAEAKRVVSQSARRVSIVTAVSPRAAVDLIFVTFEIFRVIRRIAMLYGGRPGLVGFWRLTGAVAGHLAVTGTLAMGDSLVQQVVGHGVAARLSARLGEGVVNGLLTARIGLAAIDVCRPLPFIKLPRPKLSEVTADVFRTARDDKDAADAPDENGLQLERDTAKPRRARKS